MSAQDLLERVNALPRNLPLPVVELREAIHDEHERAVSETDRSLLLELFTVIMDTVERQLEPGEALDNFREARRKDYNLFIVRECLIGENVSVDLLDYVTKREMAAGRMSADHTLRQTAEEGMANSHFSPAGVREQHEAKLREVAAPPMRAFSPSQGLVRLAAVIRWLGYGLGAIVVVVGLIGVTAAEGANKWSLLGAFIAFAAVAALCAGIGWALAWIIEGFAGGRR